MITMEKPNDITARRDDQRRETSDDGSVMDRFDQA